ncbi:methyltransferase domain-containing protein [Streptomyces sp. NRRL B-24572]|uniref:methyltransferase domain-containing protein n=1 Tax=Streptomyces sp. NRRL B-24572 TaxID=1962156 RepID=UPI00277D0894|nr:methyltransferase domain-containing protein [Streptomyces sp. NRRL B-24572]
MLLDFMSALTTSVVAMSTTPAARSGRDHRLSPDRRPSSLLAVLDAVDRAPGAAALRARSYDLLGVAAGTRLLDVGCGGGLAVAEASALGAFATGVDRDEEMIAAARERHPGHAFAVAEAGALPYEDGAWDAYRADKVLHELPDPGAALAEARRVLAPGGRAVLTGQDWDTFVLDAEDGALTRRIVHARADLVTGPRVARRFRGLLLDHGFEEVEVEVSTAVLTDARRLPLAAGLAESAVRTGAVTPEEAEAWTADQTARAAGDRFFLAVPVFTASGTRAS